MVIGIDVRCLLEKQWGGVSWHTYHTLKALFDYDKSNTYILFYNQRKKDSRIKNLFSGYKNIKWKVYHYPNWLFHLSILLFNRPYIDRLIGKCDCIWFPNLHFISVQSCPYFITCHDISFLFFKDCFSLKMRVWHTLLNLKKIFKEAKKVICVSEHTKQDVKQEYEIQSVQVISPCSKKIEEESYVNVHVPYLLCVSTLEPRKNIESVVTFFEELSDDIHLIIAGKEGWKSKNIMKAIRNSPKRDTITYLGYISEAQKAWLYKNAYGFLYPSYYEGYGIPPWEALQYETPVLTSWTSSLSESLEKSVDYVDPYHIEDFLIVYKNWKKRKSVERFASQTYEYVAKQMYKNFLHV